MEGTLLDMVKKVACDPNQLYICEEKEMLHIMCYPLIESM